MKRTIQETPQTIDEYIAGFPSDVQVILQKIRMTIHKAAPEAQETISYRMPTFNLNDHYLIYFAGYKKHVSLYPAPVGIEKFQEEMAAYISGRGTLKFPLDEPIPYGLIRRIVLFRRRKILTQAATIGAKK